jgi:hypothetical protein
MWKLNNFHWDFSKKKQEKIKAWINKFPWIYYDVFVEQITNQPQWQEKTAQPNDYFIPHSLLLLVKQSYNQKIIKQTAKEKKRYRVSVGNLFMCRAPAQPIKNR